VAGDAEGFELFCCALHDSYYARELYRAQEVFAWVMNLVSLGAV
jgi:hypothetical protein